MPYLKQTAEGSTDVGPDGLLALTFQLVHCFYKLLQYLHSESDRETISYPQIGFRKQAVNMCRQQGRPAVQLTAGELPLSRDDVGEEHSKEADGGSGQSDGRRKRSGSFISPLTQAEGIVVQRASSHTAAMELKPKHTTQTLQGASVPQCTVSLF